jgi:hypothetical protein
MMRMAQELPQAVQRLITEPAFSHHELIFKIAALIEHRCALTLRADPASWPCELTMSQGL